MAENYYRIWRKITIEYGGTFTEFGGKFLPSLAEIPPTDEHGCARKHGI